MISRNLLFKFYRVVHNIMRLLIGGSKDQVFLDIAWVPRLFVLIPKRFLRSLSLRLLALSPHYFIYQFSDRYSRNLSYGDVLRREWERNVSSRKELCEKLLKKYLRPDLKVLDLGCGPGYLAKQVSASVASVVAVDVSRGVIACAKVLCPSSNITYMTNHGAHLGGVDDNSMDLIYSFAVFQHLTKEQSFAFFREFSRVLRPGGKGVCHFVINDEEGAYDEGNRPPPEPRRGGWFAERYRGRYVPLSSSEIRAELSKAGMKNIEISPVSAHAEIDDDIGLQHLVSFES